MKTLLLCPPNHFNVIYEINPWMSMHNKVDHKKVIQEYKTLKKTYENLGTEIFEIEQDKDLPDMVYTTDFGVAINNTFISANFRYAERKKEAELARNFFKEKGFKIKTLPENIFFEGGDLLKSQDNYFLGYGPRSSHVAAEHLSNILSANVTPLELIDPYYFHLDTAFMPLNQETVVLYPHAFTEYGIHIIKNNFTTIIEASLEDSMLFACNGVVLENVVVLGKGISTDLETQIIKAGFIVTEVPMDEYKKGGGSVRCLTLRIY